MRTRTILISLIIIVGIIILVLGATTTAVLAFSRLKARPVLDKITGQIAPAPSRLQVDISPQEAGILIAGVTTGSPAEAAGIVRGDILLEANGQEVNTLADLLGAIQDMQAGDQVDLNVLHGDEQRTYLVTLEERNNRPYLGIETCQSAGRSTMIRPRVDVAGAYITEVVADSPAAEAGLQAGDIIISIDGEKISPETGLADLIAQYEPGNSITLEVTRPGEEPREVSVTLGKHPDDAQKVYLGITYRSIPDFGFDQEGILPFNLPEFDEDQDIPFQLPHFDLPEGIQSGVIIGEVVTDSPAEKSNLQAGDIITAIDGETLELPSALVNAIADRKPGDEVSLTVIKKGQSELETIVVILGENPDQEGSAFLGVRVMGMFRFGNPEGDQNQEHLPFLEELPKEFHFELPPIQRLLPGNDL